MCRFQHLDSSSQQGDLGLTQHARMHRNHTTAYAGKVSGSFETLKNLSCARHTVSTTVACVIDNIVAHFCGEEVVNEMRVEREEDRVQKQQEPELMHQVRQEMVRDLKSC